MVEENNAHDMSREDKMEASLFPGPSLRARLDIEEAQFSEGSSDEGSIQFTNIRPFYETERLNNDMKVGWCLLTRWRLIYLNDK